MEKISKIDKELAEIVDRKSKKFLNLLKENEKINSYYEQANKLSIIRLGYNDHGIMHAKIAALNSLKILDTLYNKNIIPTVITEDVGDYEDAKVAVLGGAYLHDIGLCIARENHEVLGSLISQSILEEILQKIYKDKTKVYRILPFIQEAIVCHMGNYNATSLEAKIVEVADGTDVTKGRARIPFHIGKADIHKFSALAIEKIEILQGEKKPLKFEIFMENPAGIFQVEEILMKKVKDANFQEFLEVVAKIKGEKEVRYL